MVLEKITGFFGLQGTKFVAKITLLLAAASLFGFGFMKPILEFQILNLSLLSGANIIGALLVLFALLMHKNQM